MIKGFLPPPRFAKLGTIRLGKRAVSARSGKEHPDDLDHFRVPEEVAEALHPVRQPDGEMLMLPYGPEPTELEIMLPTSDFDEFCPMQLERWDAAERLLCSGDGQFAERWSDQEGGFVKLECQYEECEFYGKKPGQGCDERGKLHVILPFVNTLGIYVINTGSRHGLRNIRDEFNAALAGVINVSGNPEFIRAVTFRLTREFKKVHYLEGGVRKPSDKYILHLRPEPLTMPQARQLAATFGTNQGAPMLSSGESIALPASAGLPALPPKMEMPEPEEPECPKDLVAGASPVGPNLGQKAAWAALLEAAQEMGKNMAALEKSVVKMVAKDAVNFEELAGETEATDAIDRLSKMIENWTAEAAPQCEAEPEPAAAAEPARVPRPADPTAKKGSKKNDNQEGLTY